MLWNYFSIAWRNLLKNQLYSLTNIGGLGLGMATCMLILLYVTHELSYDRYHDKADRIFSTLMKLKLGENDIRMNLFAPDFATKMKAANPEVVEAVRFTSDFRESPTVKSEEGRQFIEQRFFFADGSIFRVFSFNLLRGDAEVALNSPSSVAISNEMAQKYFGEANPIGKTLIYNKKDQLQVTAVFEKMPENSSLQFDFIASIGAYAAIQRRDNPDQNFDVAPNFQTWFLLNDEGTRAKIESRIASVMPKSEDPLFDKATYSLVPITEMHLGNNWGDFSNDKYLSIFLAVAGLVLFLALFNYMNLTTARAASRAREVGVRKVLGAKPGQLRGQFYGESVLISGLGFMVGLALFTVVRPMFCDLLDLRIEARFLYSGTFVCVLGALFLLSALVAGSYPAFLLSRFSPVQIIRGHAMPGGHAGAGVRRGLTVFQFAVSTGLIAFSLVIGAQLRYMQNRDIGMNREQVVSMPLTKNINPHIAAFKHEIRALAGVKKVAGCSFALFQGGWDMTFIKSPGTQEDIGINNMVVDENFFETLEIEWVSPPASPRDLTLKQQVLLNESGVEKLQLAEEPVGQYLELNSGQREIAGIVRDFNFVSLQMPIEGMLFEVASDTAAFQNPGGQLYVRLEPGTNWQAQLAVMEQIFKKYEPDAAFDYYFLDEAFDQQYRAERRLGYLFVGFSAIAAFLACLGLLGLAAFTAEQRTKEIGIRKVLGASVAGITALLAKDFLRLVLLAVLLASPLAWYFMNAWLADFAYRIELQWWMFVLAGAAALLIALLTVSFQSIRAALANPVKSLRSE